MNFLSKTPISKLKNKTAIIRIDLNIPDEREEVALRLTTILPTLKLLQKHCSKLILISHRGRPKKHDPKLSLKSFAHILKKELSEDVIFLPNFRFQSIKKTIEASSGGIFLLENLRFHKGEEKNDKTFAKHLASLADLYVAEAFASSHRAHASVQALPKCFKKTNRIAGFELEKEIKNLNLVLHKARHPLTIILGGAKVAGKFGVVKEFKNKADHILLGGGVANTYLAAKGFPIGNSLYDPTFNIKPFIRLKKITAPCDWKTERNEILDIGPDTIETFKEIIKKSKTIIWGGPLGYIEKKKFQTGTKSIAQAIARQDKKILSIVGGGETTDFLQAHNLTSKFDHVSTGGGAMLDYLSGKKLPGIEALKK